MRGFFSSFFAFQNVLKGTTHCSLFSVYFHSFGTDLRPVSAARPREDAAFQLLEDFTEYHRSKTGKFCTENSGRDCRGKPTTRFTLQIFRSPMVTAIPPAGKQANNEALSRRRGGGARPCLTTVPCVHT